jgi:hypothetical protein
LRPLHEAERMVLAFPHLPSRPSRSSLHKDSAALPFIDEYELGEYERRRATHIPMSVNGAGLD